MSITKTLSEVERRVLGHIALFRLTTAAIWPRVQDLRDIPRGDIGDAIGRLLMEKYLIRGLIVKSVRYFALAEKGASFLSAREVSKSQLQYGLLSERAKIKACGVLDFCVAPNVGWLPATDEEMRSLYGAEIHGAPSCLLFDKTRGLHCFCRVDGSLDSAPKRSAQTMRNDVLLFKKHPKLTAARAEKRLQYAFVTATKSRADRIIEQFRGYHDMGSEAVQLRIAPILVPLLQSVSIDSRGNL
jgi:hypothetical protein